MNNAATKDRGLADMYRSDASGMRYVSMHLKAGRVDSAVDAAFAMDTGARDEFPNDLWELGVAAGLIEKRRRAA